MQSKDQAADLRALAEQLGASPNEAAGSEPRGRIIAVASGKGGVGKRSLVVNLAVALASDYVLVDTAAGISDNVIRFLMAADDVLVLTTPEPTSITDVYALIKVALAQQVREPIRLVVNLATTSQAGEDVARNLAGV